MFKFLLIITSLQISLLLSYSIAQTPIVEFREAACTDYNLAASRMLLAYEYVMERYQSYPKTREYIKNAQVAWLQYHLAQIKALYPHLEYEPQTRVDYINGEEVLLQGEIAKFKPKSTQQGRYCWDLSKMLDARTTELKSMLYLDIKYINSTVESPSF